jgi:hypothetical protein
MHVLFFVIFFNRACACFSLIAKKHKIYERDNYEMQFTRPKIRKQKNEETSSYKQLHNGHCATRS